MKNIKSKFVTVFTLCILLFQASAFTQGENEYDCEVNCVFSVGQMCKTAYHIQKSGKRFQASPLDWITKYSLETCLHLFRTKFSDFFEEIKEVAVYYNYDKNIYDRHVLDTKNSILSVHHFSPDKPLDSEQKRFRKIMLERAKKVDDILSKSESIALVYSQENMWASMPSDDELKDFLKKFSEIYPSKKIYFIVVANEDLKEMKKEIIFSEGELKIIKYTFADVHKESEGNLNVWTGNSDDWDAVMSRICLKRID